MNTATAFSVREGGISPEVWLKLRRFKISNHHATLDYYKNCYHESCKAKPKYSIGLPYCERHAVKQFFTCPHCGRVEPKINGSTVYTNDENRKIKICYRCVRHHFEGCPQCGSAKPVNDLLCHNCSKDDVLRSCAEKLDALDRETALIVLEYYSVLAREIEDKTKMQFRLSGEQLQTLATYFFLTASSELRHAGSIAGLWWEDFHCLRMLTKLDRHSNKSETRKRYLGSLDGEMPDIYEVLAFLRSAYVCFNDSGWGSGGSYGGRAWAYCVWRALMLLSELYNNRGYADRFTWEACLNACHNNTRWLDKVGSNILKVLVLGANGTPKQIIDAYYADDPIRHVKSFSKGRKPEKVVNEYGRMPRVEEVWTAYFKEDYGNC